MDKEQRKKLVMQFQQEKIYYGVFQITNLANNKIFLDVSRNLKGTTNAYLAFLETNPVNPQLSADYKKYGKENFEFKILEQKEKPDDEFFDIKSELKKMLEKHLEELQPYDEKGYNKRKTS